MIVSSQDMKEEVLKSEIRLIDLIKILEALEKIYKINYIENTQIMSFIKEFKSSLRPYKFMSGKKFLNLLKTSSFWEPSKLKKEIKKIDIILTNIISNQEIRDLISNVNLTKEQLLFIAENKFGLSKGTLQKLKKEEIKEKIESAIQNLETLKAIQRKAVE